MTDYDSRHDTYEHIECVQINMAKMIFNLRVRADLHDESKLHSPEKEVFDRVTPKLKTLTYGSDEYKAALKEMGEGLKHHYQHNRHHPEYYDNGINGMTLIDLVEMLCDWRAASERHADGDMLASLEINRERFGISDQLVEILKNTIIELGWYQHD